MAEITKMDAIPIITIRDLFLAFSGTPLRFPTANTKPMMNISTNGSGHKYR